MGIFGRALVKHFDFGKLRVHLKFINTLTVKDKHFEYMRNKDDYKNSLVPLNNDLKEFKLAGPSYSFLVNEQNSQTDGFFYHLMQRENVMKLSAVQVKEILCLMANAKIDTKKYATALKYVDEKCAVSVERWPLDLSLFVLDAWFIILGPKAFKKYYYSAIKSTWSRKMKKCSKHNLILILHFIGISKQAPPFIMELLEDKLESFVDNLSDEEWAIACLSFFKTSTPMKSDLLLKQVCKVAANLLVNNDRFNLISILKCLRLSKHFDVDLLKMLSEFIKKEHSSFNFVECTNFLASFATQNVYDFEVYNCLEKHGIYLLSLEDITEFNKDIKKMHPAERSRMKDIARFLWGMAFIGHDLQAESMDFIVSLLNIRFNSGELETDLPAFIDCIQSLVLLGFYPKNLIENVTKQDFLLKISKLDKAKPKYQLYFVYRSVYLENYIKFQNLKFISHIPKNLQQDIIGRKGFQDLVNYLNKHSEANSFVCCYVMPHIMVSGVVIATKADNISPDKLIAPALHKQIHEGIISKDLQSILYTDKIYTCIEILDPSVCTYGNVEPLGLLKTKIRQLRKLNFNVITLTPGEIHLLKSHGPEHCSKISNLIS